MTTPLICIAVAYLLVYLPHFVTGVARAKLPGGFDNNHPRDQAARLEGWGRRASAAHQNGFEAFGPFAAAVLVAHVGHANEARASALAIAFVALRVIYIGAYIANLAALRSLVWFLGFACTFALFLLPLFS